MWIRKLLLSTSIATSSVIAAPMANIAKWMAVAAMAFSASAFANTYTSDLSDLWWNENESGWGVNVNHQREVVFLTFFIYGKDGRGTWYTGQASNTGQDARGALIFSGGMYEFSGPANGTTFNPGSVVGRTAGTVTFTAFLDSATLTYTIDGVAVNKTLTRQTFRNNDLSGNYMGAIKQIQSQCTGGTPNGDFNTSVDFAVSNTASSFSMIVRKPDGSSCTYGGDYIQTGRLGASTGRYTCTNGASGNYNAFELEANIQGFLGRFLGSDTTCDSVSGRFAAMRK